MSQVSGVIQEINARKVSNGTKTAYDIVVNGQAYGAGLFKPKATVGQYATFTAVANGSFFNIERGTLKSSDYKPANYEETPQATKAVVKNAVNSFDARQDAISRQAASNTAIAWVNFLHDAGALSTTAKNKGEQQARLDLLRREYEKEFYENNTGNEWKDISPTQKYADEQADPSDEDGGESEPWE